MQYCGNGTNTVQWKTQAGTLVAWIGSAGNFNGVSFTAAGTTNEFIAETNSFYCFDGASCTKKIGYDGSSFQLTGALVGSANVSGANIIAISQVLSNIGSFESQGNGIQLSLVGHGTDAAGQWSTTLRNGNAVTLSAAHDRGPARLCPDPSCAAAGVISFFSDGTTGTLNKQLIFTADIGSNLAAGNLLATGEVYAGHKIFQPVTVTNLSMYVSAAETGGGTNEVFTITDGTNTCTATFSCTTDVNTTGVKDVATANGAGTGCVYAANALVTVSLTTAGCVTTQAKAENIDIIGQYR